jgi:two-component system CAI-1 autoinducer sensor kinase/phosphatase CqsS
LYGALYTYVVPQPFECPAVRIVLAAAGLVLMSERIAGQPDRTLSKVVCCLVFWIGLPLFFCWMYWMNGGNLVWSASVVAMIFVYFFVMDWRLALPGLIGAAGLSWAAAAPTAAAVPPPLLAGTAAVCAFSLVMAVLMGRALIQVAQARLRRLTDAVGVLAHDLRTPLATMSMIGQALARQAHRDGRADPVQWEALAQRLQAVVRGMNHQIDLQIANAQLLHVTPGSDTIDAAALVADVLRSTPFRLAEEQAAVTVEVRCNFRFLGSTVQFRHVLYNLLKNALRALAARGQPLRPGDIRIGLDVVGGNGRIAVADRGVGVLPALAARLFEPFFSTEADTAHGLGLAYCRQVVQAAGGRICVDPRQPVGALFTVEVPVLSFSSDDHVHSEP